MRNKWFLLAGLSLLIVVSLAACGGTIPAPTATGSAQGASASNVPNSDAGAAFAAQTVEGGSVTVKVTPLKMKINAPLEFDIVMDTHSVDLAGDMLKAVILRDDSGMEFTPTAWNGPGGGGHHREGKIKFAPLTMSTKSLTLVVKNIAGVPERVYKWDVAQ